VTASPHFFVGEDTVAPGGPGERRSTVTPGPILEQRNVVRANIEQGLGVAYGTTQGEGFHGRYWYPYCGGSPATNIQVLAGQNAAIRVRRNVAVVPVELMEFDVE